VVAACLFKFLAVVAVNCGFLFASVACWADTKPSPQSIDAWFSYIMRNHPRPLTLDARFSALYTQAQLQLMQEHFDRVRDSYAVPFLCAILAIVGLLYLLLCALRAYLVEGLKERRQNPGPAAQAAYGVLLERARAELPADFPPTRLTIARETFVRQRLPGKITTFLGNWLLVLLGKGRTDEFRFVLYHEAFHLRCMDPLVGVVSRSLRPILALLCAGVLSDFLTENLVSPRTPWLTVLLSILFLILFFRLFRQGDFSFRRHKELLADRFAFQRQPAADLRLIYARNEKRRTHPARRERILFLRRGAGATAAEAFLAAQGLLACCVLLISSRDFDTTMAMVPRILEVPSFVLALLGTLVLGAEACAWPMPAAARKPRVAQGGVLLLFAIIASQNARTPWFSLLHIPLFGLTLLWLARQRESEVREPGKDGGDAVPILTPALWAPPQRSWHRAQVLKALSQIPSWIALGSSFFALWNSSVFLVVVGLFSQPLPSSLLRMLRISLSTGRGLFNVTVYMAIIVMACVNLRRPNRLSLGLEWLFYAGLATTTAAGFAWWYSQGLAGAVRLFREELKGGALVPVPSQRLPGAVWVEAALLSIVPLVVLSAFYVWRMRAVSSWRRKEWESGRPESTR
jgi:hypothetical protein